MDRLLENANRLLQTALDGPQGQEWTVFLDRDGGLHLIAGAETPLESVLLARGAVSAWRVRRRAETVSVEGFDGSSRCSLEGRAANPAVRGLASRGLYCMEHSVMDHSVMDHSVR